MDASAALAELVGLSTQIVEAVIADPAGEVRAARTPDMERARRLADAGTELLAAAATIRSAAPAVERVHVDLARGSLVAARSESAVVVATTVAEPTAGLLAHDLRATLRRLEDGS